MTTRRRFLTSAALALAAARAPFRPALAQGAAGGVVVVGGGFAGASCARALKALDPRLTVTLVEPNPIFTACPFSNLVIAGLRDLGEQQFSYDKVAGAGIEIAKQAATGIDPQARTVTLADGSRLSYDTTAKSATGRSRRARAVGSPLRDHRPFASHSETRRPSSR